jgi:Na+-transporting NADH:ubiquinone oxidoreductase subunit A
MALHTIKKGLDIPITGSPKQEIEIAKTTDNVAIVALDFMGLKPKMLVNVGDNVLRGQPLFEDRKNPGVLHTSPGAGKVIAINRGHKRALQTVIVELNDREKSSTTTEADHYQFTSYTSEADLSPEQLSDLLVESGLWTVFKERPFGRVPEVGSRPGALFLTCTDTEPLCPDPTVVLKGNEEDFALGVKALCTLSETVYLCTGEGSSISKVAGQTSASIEEFKGTHPAGLAGTHIHLLYGVSRKKKAWSIQLQDIIAVGHLLRTGNISVRRIISIAGPQVSNPRLFKTRLGANTVDLVSQECKDGENRIISGSPLSGRTAMHETLSYLGRFHRQITVLKEGREREFMGWLVPGGNKFSSIPIFLSSLFKGKKFDFTTTTNGEHREMVPIGMYERVMPLDIIPTFLLRALETNDTERAEKLGALELEEEDLALCSFVCPGKQDYGELLRRNLEIIHKEG